MEVQSDSCMVYLHYINKENINFEQDVFRSAGVYRKIRIFQQLCKGLPVWEERPHEKGNVRLVEMWFREKERKKTWASGSSVSAAVADWMKWQRNKRRCWSQTCSWSRFQLRKAVWTQSRGTRFFCSYDLLLVSCINIYGLRFELTVITLLQIRYMETYCPLWT